MHQIREVYQRIRHKKEEVSKQESAGGQTGQGKLIEIPITKRPRPLDFRHQRAAKQRDRTPFAQSIDEIHQQHFDHLPHFSLRGDSS